jgi:hypothetical protein
MSARFVSCLVEMVDAYSCKFGRHGQVKILH